MKKVFKIVSLMLVSALILSGCNKVELEESPEGILSPDSFFRTADDFEAMLAGGVYRPLYTPWSGFGFNAIFVLTGGGEDIGLNQIRFQAFDRLEADGITGEMADMWAQLYRSISNANTVIGSIEKGRQAGVSEDILKNAEAQARFMRAFDYFYMTRWWGEVQLITEENTLEATTTPQSSVEEIYELIVSDLQFAEANLPNLTDPSGTGLASKQAAQAYLAKVYLTMAGWPIKDASKYALARDKAKEVIDSGIFSLEPDFAQLWRQANRFTNSEFIFAFHGDVNNVPSTQHLNTRYNAAGEGGWSDVSSEVRFFEAFPDSYRKDASFTSVFANGQTFQEAGAKPHIAKYRDAGDVYPFDANSGGASGDASFNLFRYAEVLLIYAEAANMAEGSPSATALEAINKVRRRAHNLPVDTPDPSVDLPAGMSQSAFDEAVLDERAWELAFEGKRWFDLVRREMVIEANADTWDNVTETDRLLAKPDAQVTLLEGYLEQNPGY